MTRDEAREAIKVLQHYADGGEAEFAGALGSTGVDVAHWNPNKLRIKPKPAEGWVIIDSDGAIRGDYPRARLFATKEAAEEFAGGLVELDAGGCPYRVVRMVEVTE